VNPNFRSARRVTGVLLLSVAFVGCASGPTAPSPELTQRIESARTRADHEALAAYYQNEAAAALAAADKHRKMAKSYQANLQGGRGGTSMAAHCNALVQQYERIAAEYDGMAEGHQQSANDAKP
jgi:hypothetical protein